MTSAYHSIPAQALLEVRGIADITESVGLSRKADQDFQDAGFGGTADIYRGTYWQKDGDRIDIAVKCIRPSEFIGRDDEYKEKTKKKLARELEIWHALSGGINILELLGTISGIGPLPSAVAPYCAWNLKDYLERPSPPPKHIKMMTDTLQGLNYMHELKPSPVAHGDLKSHNILVTADERALICDFGRSRHPTEAPRETSNSSPFGATLRYMSPELFIRAVTGPTPASDMWAYGCVALEILCRVQPYQTITNDFEVTQRIRQGSTPSERPRGIRGALLNDSLWSTLASCWLEQGWRPTSRSFLEALIQMLESGQLSNSPLPWNLFANSTEEDTEVPGWPDGMENLGPMITIDRENGLLTSSVRSKVWLGRLNSRWRDHKKVVVKVPRLNVHPQNRGPHDHLQRIIRTRMSDRQGIRHQNIVNILGIDASQPEHPGLVLEYCEQGSLSFFLTEKPDPDSWIYGKPYESVRLKSPNANLFSLMWDVLEGLKYMHSFPIPIPQGDLTPDNILVGADGRARISLFSFGRIIAAIPAAATLTASAGPLIPFRWMSPELLVNDSIPTTESDMWSMGCVGFWLLTGLRPYAGHLRDDFAGVESVRGIPPADITKLDQAYKIGDGHSNAARDEPWITNGLWSTITRCWTMDPLRRPTAKGFLSVLRGLEGRKYDWLPLGVSDLAGKIADVDLGPNGQNEIKTRIGRYKTSWAQQRPRRAGDWYEVDMLLLRTTYTPNWYTKPIQVAIKHEFKFPEERSYTTPDKRPYIPSIRHEIAITSQLNHPNVIKLIGIDTQQDSRIPKMVFENISDLNLWRYMYRGATFEQSVRCLNDVAAALAYLHEHPNGMIVYNHMSEQTICIMEDGHAKLTNFTRAFQYATQPTQIPAPLSALTPGPRNYDLWTSPEYIREYQPEEHIPLPTAAGDVWALGILILHLFAPDHPLVKRNADIYFDEVRSGKDVVICDAPKCANMDIRLLSLARSLLRSDPAARPLASNVLKIVSKLQ